MLWQLLPGLYFPSNSVDGGKMGGLEASWQKPGESMMVGWCSHRAELRPMVRITLTLNGQDNT